jgi:hypothetical protein
VFGRQEGDTLRFWCHQEDRDQEGREGEIRLADKALVLPIEEARKLWRMKGQMAQLAKTDRATEIED